MSCDVPTSPIPAGDCERTMNLPISFLCDRFSTTIPKSQSGKYVLCSAFVLNQQQRRFCLCSVPKMCSNEHKILLLCALNKAAITRYSLHSCTNRYISRMMLHFLSLLSAGFFEFVALPLFKAWSKLFGSQFSTMLCRNIINNKTFWDDQTPTSNSSSDSEEDS